MQTQRAPGIDVLRAVAMLAVVMLHACGPGMRLPVPGLLWPVFVSAHTWACDIVFWSARCVASRAFSLVAGFVAAGLIARAMRSDNSLRELAITRVRRLGKPLLLGVVLVLPAMYFIWAWGWVQFGFANWENVFALRYGPAVRPHVLGLGHLWFLAASLASTLLMIAVANAAKHKVSAHALDGTSMLLVGGSQRLLWLVPSTACIFAFLPSSMVQFVNGFVPAAGTYLLHLVFFGVGALLWRLRDDLLAVTRWWWLELLIAALALTLLFPHLRAALLTDGTTEKPWYLPGALLTPSLGFKASLLASVAAWCAMFGALGACVRCRGAVVGAAAWLVQRQMFVYLSHLLFVGLAWSSLYKSTLPVEARACIAFVSGVVGPLALHAAWNALSHTKTASKQTAKHAFSHR